MTKDVWTRVYEMTGKAGTICPNVPDNPNPSPYKLCRGNFDDDALIRFLTMSQEGFDLLVGNNYIDKDLDITAEDTLSPRKITNWHDYIMWYYEEYEIPVGSVDNPRYEQYLRSDTWQRKRAMVLELAKRPEPSVSPKWSVTYDSCGRRIEFMKMEWKPICEKEGCAHTAEVAHHLTYENIGKENLEDLQALCKDCHYQEHPQGRKPRSFETLDGRIVPFK